MTFLIFTLCKVYYYVRVKQRFEYIYTYLARLLQIKYISSKKQFESLWNVKSNANISRLQTREGVHS